MAIAMSPSRNWNAKLGLSLPTITQNLHALEDDGLIRKGELQDSTGGRKAQNYEFNPDHRTAIG